MAAAAETAAAAGTAAAVGGTAGVAGDTVAAAGDGEDGAEAEISAGGATTASVLESRVRICSEGVEGHQEGKEVLEEEASLDRLEQEDTAVADAVARDGGPQRQH